MYVRGYLQGSENGRVVTIGAVGPNFERDTPRDHLCQVWTLHRCFLPSLAPFGQAVSEEKIFLTLVNQKKELILVAMFVGRMEPNEEAL